MTAGRATSPTAPSALPLTADDLTVAIARTVVVNAVSIHARGGSLVALVGPNGCGKTTVLRAVVRALHPRSGRVDVGGTDVWASHPRDVARLMALVAQVEHVDVEGTVAQAVALGRLPHHRVLQPRSRDDDDVVAQAMRTAGVTHLAHRLTSTLSGGERQRVAVARALAQQTPVLVLDEPTNHLDVQAQLELLELLTRLPATVVVVLHDLNLAAAYADHVHVLDGGVLVADGPPEHVLTPELITRVYGVAVARTTNPLTGRPTLHFAARPGDRTDQEDHPCVTTVPV